jgi:pimeloyl-ACP methyl ester carboxylesterase
MNPSSSGAPAPPRPKELPRGLTPSVQFALLFRPETNPTGHVPFEDADRYPFEPRASAASRINAWWLAEASWLAYFRDIAMVSAVLRDRAGLTSCTEITGGGTHGFLAAGDTFAIAAFRGTQSDDPRDLISDLLFAPGAWDVGRAHKGFAKALDGVATPLDAALRTLPAGMPVWFTGHSLGAAIATLAAWRHRTRAGGVYTIGSPLVGTREFTAAFDAVFGARSQRFVNGRDLVTHLPFPLMAGPFDPFAHARTLRRIAADGRISDVTDDEEPSSSQTSADMMQTLGLTTDLGLPPLLADHTPLYYALHTWNDFATHAP